MEKKLSIPLSKVFINEEIRKAVLDALDSGWYILQENVSVFEHMFAEFCGVNHGICVSSGTAAIFLALLALGVGPGDEVILPSFSFIATASPIFHVRAKPVFVDIDPSTYVLDPNEVRRRICNKTKAIIPVHLYGHPVDMDPILEIANKHDLYVIEDACQAHGAKYKGRKVGGIGDIACFSFYPSKNMTVCGDGGIVTTNDEEIAEKIKMLRNHGRRAGEKYRHELIGYNLRFNEIQAAIGIKQLQKLTGWIETRRKIARSYNKALEDFATVPVEKPWAKHVYYMYVIKCEKRDDLQRFLADQRIATGIHYPIPIHQQPAISRHLTSQPKLKNTELCAKSVLSLPTYPELTQIEIKYICEKIVDYYTR